ELLRDALGGEDLGAVLATQALAFAASLARAGWLPGGDEVMLAVADEIGAAHALQGLAQQRPVLGIVIAQERLVKAPLLQAFHRLDRFRGTAPDRAQGIQA